MPCLLPQHATSPTLAAHVRRATKEQQKSVISASRRTDIAAFYSKWFLNRIRAEWCEWRNPFGGRLRRVSLRPDDVLAIVFWTRHPAPLLPHLEWLASEGYRFYFHVTINGYPRELESHSPPLDRALDAFRRLSDAVSPAFAHWRYDPVLLGDLTPPEYHLERFGRIAAALEGRTGRCYFSFVDYYGKTRRNLSKVPGLRFYEPALEEKQRLARELSAIARSRNITMYSCCGDALAGDGIVKASCVDAGLIGTPLKSVPTRPGCGCTASTDIGAYDTCAFGCTYCYATNSRAAALTRLRAHDPAAPVLHQALKSG